MERTLRFSGTYALMVLAAGAIAAPQYRFHDLGNKVTRTMYGVGISNTNEVIVASQDVRTFSQENFSWINGQKRNLQGVGGPHAYYTKISPVGTYYSPSGYYNGQSYIEFPKLSFSSGQYHSGQSIESMNSSGLAVGYAIYTDYDNIGYIYKDGKAQLASGIGEYTSRFSGLNDYGRAMVTIDSHLFLWDNGTYTDVTKYLYLPSTWVEYASFDINNHDVFVGVGGVHTPDGRGGYTREFLPSAENGVVPGAYSINNRGDIVGAGKAHKDQSNFDPKTEGYLSTGGKTYKFRDIVENPFPEAAFDIQPTDINDNGWIVGAYRLGDPANFDTQSVHAFAMEPVPEPLTMLTLGLGVAALRRRRK